VLLLMHYMELGGAEASILGLLQSVDPKRADVDVFIYAHKGELMPYIDPLCSSDISPSLGRVGQSTFIKKWNLLPEEEIYSLLEEPIAFCIKKGYWRLALARLWGRWETQRYSKKNTRGLESNAHVTFQQHRTVKCLPMINPVVEYDLAISFLTPHYIVLDKVRAKKKLGWIHTDYTNVFINREMELRMWERLDVISSISPDVTDKFVQVFPSLKDRVIDIENILSPRFIRLRSLEECPVLEKDPCLKLLTIGRYSYAKKMEDIPYLCRRLVESGLDVHWYIIGYGSEEIEQQILQAIQDEGMRDRVIMLGKQSNPYPYIRCCDVYVQPSRYEGKSITVREAQILCKPVIVTHYPTATSQVRATPNLPRREGVIIGCDGMIVPLEKEACAESMIEVLKDKELITSLSEYLREHDYGNEDEIEKIYALCK